MRRKRRKIALLLTAAIILSSGTGIGMRTVPDKAATQAAENKSVEETLVYPIDEDNKDEQGVIYTLDSENKTAKVTGQEILDEGEIRIPDQVQKGKERYDVKEVARFAFKNCLLITSLIVSDTVEVFNFDSLDKTSCKKLFLGAGVWDIDCCNEHKTNLYEIEVDEDNPYYIVDNKILYDISKTKVVKCPTRLSVSGTLHLPETVRTIGMNAFSYCQIESIDLSSVVYIDSEAFVWCKDLIFADLRNCRRMEQHIFDYCRPSYIRLRENLEMSNQPFYVGTNVTSLYLPTGAWNIEDSGLLFSDRMECFITGTDILSTKDRWSYLKKGAILDGVTSVDQTMLTGNQIEKIYIPPSVTKFTAKASSFSSGTWKGTIYGSAGSAAEAFAKEKGKKFKVHEEADHVWHYGTYWEDEKIHYKGEICDICSAIKNVSVLYGDEMEAPEPVKDLVYDLDEDNRDSQGITYTLRPYNNASSLKYARAGNGNAADACQEENVVIPDFVRKDGILYKVTALNPNFLGEKVLTLTLGEWVNTIDTEAFVLASELKQLSVSDRNIDFRAEDNVLFNKEKTQLLWCPPKRTGCYQVPYPVNTIASYAFRDSQLSDVILPARVTNICDYAFYGSHITSINLSGAAYVGKYAFQKCLQLRWALFGNKLRETGSYIFDQCVRLEAIYMPYIKKTGNDALTDMCNACYQLRILHLPEGMTAFGKETIRSLSKLEYLYIPSSVRSIQLYDFDKEKLVLYGEKGAAVSTYASANEFQFSAIDGHEHSWEDYVLSAYEGRSLVGKRCESCGYVTDVHGMIDGVDWEELVKPTPTPTATATAPVTEKPTSKPTATATATVLVTEKPTPTPTATEKPTPTATATVTVTATEKPTSEPTATAMVTSPVTEKPTAKPTVTVPATESLKPTQTPVTTATPKNLPSLISDSTAATSSKTKEVSPEKKKKTVSITVKPVISVKKKQRAKIRYIQVNLKKYRGTYIQIYVKVGKKPFRRVSKKKINIRKYKRKFRIKYVKKKQKIQIKVRTYYIKNKKKIYSRYSKVRRITT